MKPAKEILDNFYREEKKYVAEKSQGKGDASAMLSWISSDYRVIQSPDLPWGGEWIGRQGMADWAAQMGEKFSVLEVQNPVIYEASDGNARQDGAVTELLVRSNLHLVVLGTNAVYSHPLVQIVKVDTEREQIVEIIPIYWNVAGLNALLREAGHIK